MTRSKVDFDTVRKVGLGLPGVEEGTTYGSPALKSGGKVLACLASHRSAEPGSLVVHVGFERRAELVEADPEVYYFTDHYAPYPAVLARLSRIRPDDLRDLLGMAWRFVAASSPKRRR